MKKQLSLLVFVFLFSVFNTFSIELITIGVDYYSDRLSLQFNAGCAEVQFRSRPDKQYTVEFSEDLETWVPVAEEIFGTGSNIICTNQLDESQKGFYRMKYSDEFVVSMNPDCFHIGNRWVYSITQEDLLQDGTWASSTRTQIELIKEVGLQNGYDAIGIRMETDRGVLVEEEYILRDTSDGVFIVGVKDADSQTTYYAPPEPSPINRFVSGVQGPPVTHPSVGPGFSETTFTETVSAEYGVIHVPAGSFQNTIKVDSTITGTYTEGGQTYLYTHWKTIWRSKEVGEVKSVTVTSIDGVGYVMVETKTLTSYDFS